MDDRVHPTDQQPLHPLPTALSDVPLRDDHTPASAPPHPSKQQDHSQKVPVQAPPAQKPLPTALPRDVIYKLPPPLPADHPSIGKRRRLSPCCCYLTWLCSLLTGFVTIIVIAALVFYLVAQPRALKYDVRDLRISRFNVTNRPLNATAGKNSLGAPYLNSDIQLTIAARNPNKKIGFYYDGVQVSVAYEEVQIGQGSILPFYQGHKNTTALRLDLKGRDIALNQSVGAMLNRSLQAKSDITLQIETTARVAMKVGSWKSSHVKARVLCSVEITAPTSGTVKVISQSCKLKNFE